MSKPLTPENLGPHQEAQALIQDFFSAKAYAFTFAEIFATDAAILETRLERAEI
jgi:hypothetical protein